MNMILQIDYKKLIKSAKEPKINYGDACFDFYCPQDVMIPAFSMGVMVPTGLAFEIPYGYHMKLFMRSSYGANSPLRQSNCVGIIDSSYRGEVKGLFDNMSNKDYVIKAGERFMQGLIEKNIQVAFWKSDHLSETERGEGGFGSTGK